MTNRARMRAKRRRKKSANHAGIVIESVPSPPEVQRAIQRKFREARERMNQPKRRRDVPTHPLIAGYVAAMGKFTH